MGFLSMIGAVSAEEYAALDTKHKAAIKDLAAEVEARDKYRDQVRDTCARAEKAEASLKIADNQTAAAIRDRDEAIRNYSEMSGIVSQRDAEIVALRAEVADLKPDAQATRQRRWNDRNRERPSRAKTRTVKDPTPGSDVEVARVKPAPKAKAAAKKAVRK